MEKTIIFVGSDAAERESFVDYFTGESGFRIVGTAADGKEALTLLMRLNPNILILNLLIPEMDGFSVLRQARSSVDEIIVLSALSQDCFAHRAISLGADYVFIKPASPQSIKEYLMHSPCTNGGCTGVENCQKEQCCLRDKDAKAASPDAAIDKRLGIANRKNDNYLEEKIMRVFLSIGIPINVKGYYFLKEAIKITVQKPYLISNITKGLYPEVASYFGTSSSKVERAMRHAIEVAWNRGMISNMDSLFNMPICNQYDKPTNSQFIALIADRMLVDIG